MFDNAFALALDPRVRRWSAPAVVLAAVVGVGLATLTGGPEDPAETLEKARDLMVEHRPEAALKQTRRALAMLGTAGDPELRLKALARAAQIADLHMPDAYLPEAMGYYRDVVQQFPATDAAFEAGIRLGEILKQRLHDDLHAEEQFAQVVEAFPNQPGVERYLIRAGQIALDARRYVPAREHARKLLERYPQSELGPEAQAMIGRSFQLEGRLKDATTAFETLADRWPETEQAARALAMAGDCHFETGDYGRALARYIASLARHPDPMLVQKSLERARRRFSAQRELEPGSKTFAFYGGY